MSLDAKEEELEEPVEGLEVPVDRDGVALGFFCGVVKDVRDERDDDDEGVARTESNVDGEKPFSLTSDFLFCA